MKPLIIAHRGASALAPENTLAAFRRAIADGADGIEFDVRLAKDNVPVVFHDAHLKRIAGIERRISDFTSEELQNIDAGSWFNRKYPHKAEGAFSAETIPTLAQFFDFLGDYKGLLYVEMKCFDAEIPALVKAVCGEIMRRKEILPQIKLKSFKLRAVENAKKHFSEIRTVALFAPKLGTLLRKQTYLIEKAESALADELSLHYSLATQNLMKKAHEKNFPVTIWTADNPAWVRRAINLGIEAVITNNPARLLAKRGLIK